MTTGSANPPFTAFAEKDPVNSTTTLQYQSISAMPQYNAMSFEVSRTISMTPTTIRPHILCRSSGNKTISKVGRPQELLDRRHLGHPQRNPNPLLGCLVNLHNSPLQQALRSEASVTPALNKQGRRRVSAASASLPPRQEPPALLARACLAGAAVLSAKPINNHSNSRSSSQLGLVPLASLSSNNNNRAVAYSVVAVHLVPISRNLHLVRPCMPCSYG